MHVNTHDWKHIPFRTHATVLVSLVVAAVAGHLPLATCPSAEAAETKIGYVSIARVFEGYQRTKNSDAVLEKKGQQKEAELEGRVSELKKLRQNLELMADDAKDVKAREIEEKADELQRFRNATARDLGRERDRIAKELLKDIQQVIEQYGAKNGYAMILDDRSLLYGQQVYDITDQILQMLNAPRAAAPAAPPAPASSPAPRRPQQ